MGLLTDRSNNKSDKRNLISEHALNREHVPLSDIFLVFTFAVALLAQFFLLQSKIYVVIECSTEKSFRLDGMETIIGEY